MKAILCIALLCSAFVLGAQNLLKLDTTKHCIYSGSINEELYTFNADRALLNVVNEICLKGDLKAKINVYYANVPNVVCLLSDTSYVLLVNYEFFNSLQKDVRRYALIAHEIGHIASKDHLDGVLRVGEESRADEFMGYVLMQMEIAQSLDFLLNSIINFAFNYSNIFPWLERKIAIQRGWNRAFGLINGLGFENNPLEVEKLPLPKFDQISCIPATSPLFTSKLTKCKTLGELDGFLVSVLNKLGYKERSYYALNGGYVMTTNIEQFEQDGSSVQGIKRWQDCPKKEKLGGLFSYLYTLVNGTSNVRLRLFAFIVSKEPTIKVYEPGCVDPKNIPEWLRHGGSWLPDSIAKEKYQPQYRLKIMVFEFFVPDSTKKARDECQRPLDLATHLAKSGIMNALH